MRDPRVALLGFYHETNTFSRARTGLDLFHAYQYAEGEDLVERYRGTGTEPGGVIDGAEEQGFELVPILFAAAVPSGPITTGCFEEIIARCEAGLAAAGPLDGVVVVLHGAAASESEPDADGTLLQAVRRAAGPAMPIVATLDFHANVSEKLVQAANAITGYRTYPHVDMADRGREAIRLLGRLLGGEELHGVHVKLPLLTVPQCQATDDEPMRSLMGVCERVSAGAGIVSASVLMGFAYADCKDLGASVLVYADSAAAAQTGASEIAGAIWSRREEFVPELMPVADISRLAGEGADVPVVLLDPADNVGGGSAGDGTDILAELIATDIKDAVIVICDPDAVQVAAKAGVGGEFDGDVGARTDDLHGVPVRVTGKITYLRDTNFTHSGSYMTGFVTRMGLTAIVDTGATRVVLTSLRTMPFDIEQLRSVGIEPKEQRVIVAKSAIAWRAAYGDVARSVFTIDTPGICTSNVERLDYRLMPRPMFPLDAEATFER